MNDVTHSLSSSCSCVHTRWAICETVFSRKSPCLHASAYSDAMKPSGVWARLCLVRMKLHHHFLLLTFPTLSRYFSTPTPIADARWNKHGIAHRIKRKAKTSAGRITDTCKLLTVGHRGRAVAGSTPSQITCKEGGVGETPLWARAMSGILLE
jgi:hypothetical protein